MTPLALNLSRIFSSVCASLFKAPSELFRVRIWSRIIFKPQISAVTPLKIQLSLSPLSMVLCLTPPAISIHARKRPLWMKAFGTSAQLRFIIRRIMKIRSARNAILETAKRFEDNRDVPWHLSPAGRDIPYRMERTGMFYDPRPRPPRSYRKRVGH